MFRSFLCSAVLALAQVTAQAQQQPVSVKTIETPADPAAIPLGTGGVANAVAPETWIDFYGHPMARNVQQATLTPVLPDKGKATGAAVVVAPGGAFVMLSMQDEGWAVAHWLAGRGVAAFVLKYRLRPTPVAVDGFLAELNKVLVSAGATGDKMTLEATADAVNDGRAALRLVRARAKEWGVDPARVGMMGFSAGAMTTLGVALNASPDTMPAFIAPIYGPVTAVTVPAAAPPLFVAMAADDPVFAHRGFGLIESWNAAKKPVEFHLYQRAGHGFGVGAPGTTTLGWLDSFFRWLDMNGFLKKHP
jgi:acetyl esterase/lipase